MGLFSWVDSKVKKMRWYDISLTKLSVAGFILALAILWPPLLSVDWRIYGLIFVVAGGIELYRMLKK